jgi:hypothetical protein
MILRILNKTNFIQKFLTPISRINELCTLTVQKNNIYNLNRTADTNFSLYSVCSDVETEGVEENVNLSFADVKKLIKVLDCLSENSLNLFLNKNNVEYNDKGTKFRFHLINDNIVKSPNYNIDKINALQFDTEFKLTNTIHSHLIKSSTFITDSNKIYISTENGCVMAELTDKSKNNIDSYSVKISDFYGGDSITKPVSFNFDLFRNLSYLKTTEASVRLNTKMGFIAFDIQDDKYKLKYTATAYSI